MSRKVDRRAGLSAISRLHWLSVPSRLLPHGALGLLGLSVGAVILGCVMVGSFAASRSVLLPLYLCSQAGSAVAGGLMANRAGRKHERMFKITAFFQLCLLYHAWRFHEGRSPPGQLVDLIFAVCTVVGICAIAIEAILLTKGGENPALAGAILFGCLTLLLLAGYPLELALWGEDWWTCVQAEYSLQAVAMSSYIYVSASWSFAVMVFGATLFIRKIVTARTCAACFAALALATLGTTVIMQEVHYPAPASTQRLYLPCPAPEPGTLSAWSVHALDTSALAQSILRAVGHPRFS